MPNLLQDEEAIANLSIQEEQEAQIEGLQRLHQVIITEAIHPLKQEERIVLQDQVEVCHHRDLLRAEQRVGLAIDHRALRRVEDQVALLVSLHRDQKDEEVIRYQHK